MVVTNQRTQSQQRVSFVTQLSELSRAVTMVDGLPHAANALRPIQVLITCSAPIRFASKVEIVVEEVKTYPEMYLMSSGYSSGKSYADEHDFQKVKIFEMTRRAPLAQRVILLQRKSWSALNATKRRNGGIKVIISFFPQVRFDWE